jgi:threonyl-tRNA synthetase
MMIVPVAEKFVDYAYQCKQKAVQKGLRVKVDDSDMSFSKKIREAELKKIPYIAIVGEKEETDGTLSMRVYKTKQQFTDGCDTIINNLVTLYQTRSLD